MSDFVKVAAIGGIVVGGVHFFSRDSVRDVVLPPGDYSWPMPDFEGMQPEVSHEFEPGGKHPGLDVMFRLPTPGVLPTGWSAAPGWVGSKLKWGIPPGMLNVAAHDGELLFAGDTGVGYSVVLATPDRTAATYYTHMRNGRVGGAGWKASGHVYRGEPLGSTSYSPQDGESVPHLHFEWRVAREGMPGVFAAWPKSCVDPWPLLKHWPHIPGAVFDGNVG